MFPKQPWLQWLIGTLVLISLLPLLLVPIGLASILFAPNDPAAILFRVISATGAVLLPTTRFIGQTLLHTKAAVLLWIVILLLAWGLTSFFYADFHKSQRTQFVQQNFPPYPGATLQSIEHVLGNAFTIGPSTSISFSLDGADSKLSELEDFYQKELLQRGWQKTKDDATPYVSGDWFIESESSDLGHNSAYINEHKTTSEGYVVTALFKQCNDFLCATDNTLFRLVEFVLEPKDALDKFR